MLYPRLTETCAALRDVFDARTCMCALVVDDGTELLFVAGDGQGAAELLGVRLGVEEGLAGYIALAEQPIAVLDVQRDERFAPRLASVAGYDPRRMLGAPLLDDTGRVIGVVNVTDPSEEVVAEARLETGGLLAQLMVAAPTVARVAQEETRTAPGRARMRLVPQPADSGTPDSV